MPFVRRVVNPEFVCRKNSLIGCGEVLIDQNNYTCINFIRQLASLSNHAQDIFSELDRRLEVVTMRSDMVARRLDGIKKALPSANSSAVNMNQSDIGGGQNQFQITVQIDSMTLVRDSMPAALRKVYESCRKIPDLHLLDAIRTDGIKTRDLYSKPEFFYETWLAKIDKDMEKRKKKKKQEKVTQVVEEKPVAELPKSRRANIVEKAKAADIGAIGSVQRVGTFENENFVTLKDKSDDSLNRISPVSNAPLPQKPVSVPQPSVPYTSQPIHQEVNQNFPTRPGAVTPPNSSYPPSVPNIPPQQSYKQETSIRPSPPQQPPASVNTSFTSSAPPPAPPPPPPAPAPPPPSVPALSVPRNDDNSESDNQSGGTRNELLNSIRGGKSLKKVDANEVAAKKAAATTSVHGMDVASILAERIKVICMSDESEEEEEDDEWD